MELFILNEALKHFIAKAESDRMALRALAIAHKASSEIAESEIYKAAKFDVYLTLFGHQFFIAWTELNSRPSEELPQEDPSLHAAQEEFVARIESDTTALRTLAIAHKASSEIAGSKQYNEAKFDLYWTNFGHQFVVASTELNSRHFAKKLQA